MNAWILGSLIAITALLAAMGLIVWNRQKTKKQIERLEQMLSLSADEIRRGKYFLDETMDGKIAQKLLDLYRDLELEYKDAENEKESVKAFIADISHQMKTPLTNIGLYHDLLLDDRLTSAERHEFLANIHFEQQKMTWLLASLTKIARLETNAIVFEAVRADVVKTISQAVKAVEGQAKTKNIALLWNENSAETPMTAYHNAKWTAEALINIMENAIKYSPKNASISIVIEKLELYIRVKISDQGVGIAKADYNNIFKRFFRGENVAGQPGSGLGLYLAQLIMAKQEGYITVESQLGRGSTFSVYVKR
jgi:signal transduction histidine kinase